MLYAIFLFFHLFILYAKCAFYYYYYLLRMTVMVLFSLWRKYLLLFVSVLSVRHWHFYGRITIITEYNKIAFFNFIIAFDELIMKLKDMNVCSFEK